MSEKDAMCLDSLTVPMTLVRWTGKMLLVILMGLFGIAEVLSNAGRLHATSASPIVVSLRSMIPSREELAASVMPTVRGSLLGSVVGILPGAGPAIASFMSYAVEKKVAKDPSRFGNGAIEGVAAPEAANNAAAQSAFIPTLSLGIPGDPVLAVILGALLIHGITPGPQFVVEQPVMFWGLVVSFWIGNLMLVAINLPLIGLWVRIVTIPYNILCPSILFFVCIGVYSINNSVFDIYVALGFGIVGYFMVALHYPAAPLLLGFILGPMMEEYFKRALLQSRGDIMTFIDRPLSAIFLAATLLLLLISLRPLVLRPRIKKPIRG